MNDYKNRRDTESDTGIRDTDNKQDSVKTITRSIRPSSAYHKYKRSRGYIKRGTVRNGRTETRSEGKAVRDKVIRRTGGKIGENSNG